MKSNTCLRKHEFKYRFVRYSGPDRERSAIFAMIAWSGFCPLILASNIAGIVQHRRDSATSSRSNVQANRKIARLDVMKKTPMHQHDSNSLREGRFVKSHQTRFGTMLSRHGAYRTILANESEKALQAKHVPS